METRVNDVWLPPCDAHYLWLGLKVSSASLHQQLLVVSQRDFLLPDFLDLSLKPLLLGPLVTTGVIRGTINKMLKLHGLQGIYSAWLETITAHILLMCHLGSFCSVHRFPFFFPGCVSSPPELPAISPKVWKSHKWSTEISRPLCFNWIWTKTTSFRLTSLYLMLLFCKKRGISEHLYPIIMTLDL